MIKKDKSNNPHLKGGDEKSDFLT